MPDNRTFFDCRACGGRSEFVTINQAAGLAGTGWREMVRRIDSGEVHSAETATGEIFICARSLECQTSE